MLKEKDDDILGKRVRVIGCDAREHRDTSLACVCHLKGKVVEVTNRCGTRFLGTSMYHIKDFSQRVRRSEVTLLDD